MMMAAKDSKPVFTVKRIVEGFEFGHGRISGRSAERRVLGTVDRAIHEDPAILIPIGKDPEGRKLTDDGCGDGREVVKIFSYGKRYQRSLNRSKVFGGSAAMTVASLIGLGQAGKAHLNGVFDRAIGILDGKGMDFGAHTDDHAEGENCGCGAIDKAPEILLAILKYEKPIREVASLLADDTSTLDEVYANFREYAKHLALQREYSGKQVMDSILANEHNRIVKQLSGEHRECRIVFNTIRGYTTNQKLIRDLTKNKAQIFGVDVWRMREIAHKLYAPTPKRQSAFLSGLIYTVATAAVLTKGDLPVYMVREKAAEGSTE